MREKDPNRERYLLSEADNSRIFHEHLFTSEYGLIQGIDTPSAHFFGAQPGAGKSVLQGSVRDGLISRDGLNSVMTIAGDRFRAYHPEYGRLLEEDDESAALYTDMDTNRWVEKSIDVSYSLRPHVILENTLRNAAISIDSARQYRERQFGTSMHIVAVSEFISRLRIFGRYFDQIERTGRGRYTAPSAHDISYEALPNSLSAIASADVFDEIALYDLYGQQLIRTRRGDTDGETYLQQALSAERDVRRLNTTELFDTAIRYEQLAHRYGRTGVLRDIAKYRDDLTSALAEN